MTISRRTAIKYLAGSGIATGIAVSPAYAFSVISTFNTVLERVTVKVRDLPTGIAGLRIAFATDLHYSANVPFDFLAASLLELAAEQADLTVWGGDYIAVNGSRFSRAATELNDGFQREHLPYREQATALTERLPDLFKICARAPSVAVRGNHEIWVAPDAVAAAADRGGVRLLVNETFRFSRAGYVVELAGVDDFWNGVPIAPQFSPDAALKILVAHNPDYVALLESKGLATFDLALCGHTHGGQIKLPLVGALTYNARSRFTEGLRAVDKQPVNSLTSQRPAAALCYTSRGLGVVEIPLRVNCPPETTLLTIESF